MSLLEEGTSFRHTLAELSGHPVPEVPSQQDVCADLRVENHKASRAGQELQAFPCKQRKLAEACS